MSTGIKRCPFSEQAGKTSGGKRKEKRATKFKQAARKGDNILRDEDAAPKRKRPAEADGFGMPEPKKRFKERTFERPEKKAPAAAPAAPAAPLTKRDLKQLSEARKAKERPNYSAIQDLTAAWERLRRLETKAAERERLVAEVARKSAGRVRQLAMSHKASRVLQSILKWGTPPQKAALQAEALPDLVILAKDTYGTHLARKLVDEADKADLPALLKAFKARRSLPPCAARRLSSGHRPV